MWLPAFVSLSMKTTVRAKRNVHPLARTQFQVAAAPADLPMDRMLLVLKRSPEQETAF